MVQCIEKRGEIRHRHAGLLMIKDSKTGQYTMARMINYCAQGMYFETSVLLEPGEKIEVGIENSPYTPIPDIIDCYQVTVMWRKEPESETHKYGYGVQLSLERLS